MDAKLQEALKPLHEQLSHVCGQQDDALRALRGLWSEMRNITRRLNELDGKWM